MYSSLTITDTIKNELLKIVFVFVDMIKKEGDNIDYGKVNNNDR